MNAYIFDVDGVITHPVTKQVNQELLLKLAELIKAGHIVAFNTGRSFEWLKKPILEPLSNLIKTTSLLSNVFAVCEMGNVTAEFKTEWNETPDPKTSIPNKLKTIIKNIVNSEYSDSMFFDEKKTMISVEYKDGSDHAKYLEKQATLPKIINKIIRAPDYKSLHLKTLSNQIAIDVVNENSGKKLGVQKIIAWFKKIEVEPSEVLIFGDNVSDFEMAEEFQKSYPTEFVFVGSRSYLASIEEKSDQTSKIITTNTLYDQGTLEFLNS